MMIADVGSVSKPMVGEEIGSYNRKFAQNWRKILVDKFGEQGQNVTDSKRLSQQLASLQTKFNENMEQMGNLGQGYEKLSTFSEWLDNLDNNNFYNPYEYIEVPG